jgi:hypothetical protein
MGIATVILALILLLFLIVAIKGAWMCDIDSEVTTTTTVSEESYDIVGNLKREFGGGEANTPQAFVIDPADQQKIWLNSNDDMYEDANGRIWRLV